MESKEYNEESELEEIGETTNERLEKYWKNKEE
jgi:hypothetical protein